MADRPENRQPIQIKPVHSSVSYQWAIYQKYDRRGHESPSGYGPLGTDIWVQKGRGKVGLWGNILVKSHIPKSKFDNVFDIRKGYSLN